MVSGAPGNHAPDIARITMTFLPHCGKGRKRALPLDRAGRKVRAHLGPNRGEIAADDACDHSSDSSLPSHAGIGEESNLLLAPYSPL
jgi:hypothetical protein